MGSNARIYVLRRSVSRLCLGCLRDLFPNENGARRARSFLGEALRLCNGLGMRVAILNTFALVTFAGCCCSALYTTAGASSEQLLARAAFDLECSENELSVVELDERTRGVRGCERQATYVETCQRYGDMGHKEGCSWVLNTEKAPPPRSPDQSAQSH